jgi:acetoacetyl-CoA synthetase|tara:strand:+ start:2416 stop:2670 length:255 start_codon:yes stop_codon:yes gene_type:complete
MNSVSTSRDLATPVPQIRLYRDWLQETRGIDFATYDELYRWSVEDLEGFWRSIWEWDRIQSPTAVRAVLSGEAMPRRGRPGPAR